MKITIVGAGAMGCLLAAFLARNNKHEVWVLEKNKERAEKIREQGIRVEGVSGAWQVKVRATTDAGQIGVAELVIISVKSYHTKEAVTAAAALIGDETRILTLQNGIGNIEIISEVAGAQKVIAGSTNEGATLLGVGQIRHAGRGDTILGRMDGKIPVEMRAIRELFNKAGFSARLSRDIKGVIWSKLIINAGINALTAITRLPNGKILEFEGTRRILREAVSEAARIAKRKRIKLVYDDPLVKAEAVCEATASNISSMLADVLRKKRTEIDFINGVVVRQAQELGIPAPVNLMLVDLVKTIEASYEQVVNK
jgi:2-dehydropantoate 2-reductase